jgi:LacI family transcriptional regulator
MNAPIVVLIASPDDGLDAQRIQSGILKALADIPHFLAVAPFKSRSKARYDEIGKIVGQVHPTGAIITPQVSGDEELCATLQATAIPQVSIAPDAHGHLDRQICSNDRQGTCDAANYLIAIGHKRIGFVSISDESAVAREREGGFLDALALHGLDQGAELVVPAENTAEAAREAALLLLFVSPRPTAILASSDLQAAGVLQAASLSGIAVPANLSVMGFGDADLAAALTPPLTTMHIPYAEMGFTAAIKLLDPARADMQPVEFFCKLVVRESTAPLP